ncbi:unnamed protein product [Ostreobium quekettii]|uniref:Uncharacterized protein n=1 Tax=Ostreobium quekettii TaxID=121088 RepID=A0A8S1ISA4_9CHLO|nr:unnamed protein product [Ostreobium quekettii]
MLGRGGSGFDWMAHTVCAWRAHHELVPVESLGLQGMLRCWLDGTQRLCGVGAEEFGLDTNGCLCNRWKTCRHPIWVPEGHWLSVMEAVPEIEPPWPSFREDFVGIQFWRAYLVVGTPIILGIG